MSTSSGNIGSYCDKCGKFMKPFTKTKINKEFYMKGDNHKKLSSDIKTKSYKIMDLCPECSDEFDNIINKFLKCVK